MANETETWKDARAMYSCLLLSVRSIMFRDPFTDGPKQTKSLESLTQKVVDAFEKLNQDLSIARERGESINLQYEGSEEVGDNINGMIAEIETMVDENRRGHKLVRQECAVHMDRAAKAMRKIITY
jgi:hypothetical protein